MSVEWLSMPAVLAEANQDGMWMAIIFVTVSVTGSTWGIVSAVIKHRERMAKIGMGIDPDAAKAESTSSGGCCG
jgi:hypothetical protein